jgi:hypothetical protein
MEINVLLFNGQGSATACYNTLVIFLIDASS